MDLHSDFCQKSRRKKILSVLKGLSSDSSLTSISDSFVPIFESGGLDYENQVYSKPDYLSRLFEKQKLKDKSLSKRMRTPFDRKINRTCWPIEISKVSKIKKKPQEKKKQKPDYRSLKKEKFSHPTFARRKKENKKKRESITDSEPEVLDNEASQKTNLNHFLYEPVTPQMLIGVLQDPEFLKSGATIDMIIAKLRALKLSLNPTLEMLKEEVLVKLHCAIKLGLIVKKDGFYKVAKNPGLCQLSRKKEQDFWTLWHCIKSQ